jgi:hypothetical protein
VSNYIEHNKTFGQENNNHKRKEETGEYQAWSLLKLREEAQHATVVQLLAGGGVRIRISLDFYSSKRVSRNKHQQEAMRVRPLEIFSQGEQR